jgi:hypothetical protein
MSHSQSVSSQRGVDGYDADSATLLLFEMRLAGDGKSGVVMHSSWEGMGMG